MLNEWNHGWFGIILFPLIAWLLSEQKAKIKWQTVATTLLAQFVLAFVILRNAWISQFFLYFSQGIDALKQATQDGTSFVFGYTGGGKPPFAVVETSNLFIFGFQALPMIMVVSSLAMLLFHWRVLPVLVSAASKLLQRTLGLGGALGICAAAKVFLGQTEAPLLIRPYLTRLSRSELFTVMTLGMATTSAAVMVIYASILSHTIDNPIRHVLTAAMISLPAAVLISRLMVPPDEKHTDGNLVMPYQFTGAMQAVSKGASDGMQLFLNIIAMLIVMIALVSLANSILGQLILFGEPLSLQRILGAIMMPLAWAMGIDMHEASLCGNLLGTKIALNEVIAFIDLSRLPDAALSVRSRLMMTYALCGFANFSSVGIQVGALGTMAPERQTEITELGMKAMLAGSLSSFMSATLVGLLY